MQLYEQLSLDEDAAINASDIDVAGQKVHDDSDNSTRNRIRYSLKNDVPTRWNSTLEMVKSMLDLKKNMWKSC